MLLPSFFIIDLTKHDHFPNVQMPENAFISFKIDPASFHLIDSFYKKLFLSSPKNSFCLLIELNSEIKKRDEQFDTIAELLVSFSFHSKYLKTGQGNPFFLFETDLPDADNYISTIRKVFKEHGYKDIEAIKVYNKSTPASKDENRNVYFRVNGNIDSLSSEYSNSIKQLTSDSTLFFFMNDSQSLPELLDRIEKTETIIHESMPQAYGLLKENMFLKAKQRELILERELLQEQLDSLSSYQLHQSSDSRYKRQITELLNFYKNEYEILPIWYKRFGHIIKVLTGKRTFRSLFDKKTPKYRK